MAITVWPVDAVTGAPSYTGRALREAQSVFMAGASAADPFGVRSGVRPGTSTTTVTATSTTWTIGAHGGILDLEAAVEASGYGYAINATGGLPTGAVTAAHATLPRVDIVWLRTDDPAESDGSSVPAVIPGYTAGTAASSPTAPATPARCMVLAWINVPASGGGSPTVTWKAPYCAAAGAPIPVNSQTERDALVAYLGLQVKRLDVAGVPIETYNGTVWVDPLSISGATSTKVIKTGVTAVTTVTSGDASIATGLSSIDFFIAYNGRSDVAGNLVFGRNVAGYTGGTATFRCFVGQTGAGAAGINVTVDWMAVGTP